MAHPMSATIEPTLSTKLTLDKGAGGVKHRRNEVLVYKYVQNHDAKAATAEQADSSKPGAEAVEEMLTPGNANANSSITTDTDVRTNCTHQASHPTRQIARAARATTAWPL